MAREKAEAERKRLEEEIAQLKASQEKQARGCHNLCSLLLSFMIIFSMHHTATLNVTTPSCCFLKDKFCQFTIKVRNFRVNGLSVLSVSCYLSQNEPFIKRNKTRHCYCQS